MNVTHIAVIGAGIMGSGIAKLLGEAGYEVALYDARLDIARDLADSNPRVTAYGTLESAVRQASVIIEAVVEDLNVKRALFAEIEQFNDHSPIASNTSTFSPSELAAELDDKGRLVIAHFFNPAEVVPLVEIVSSPDSRREVTSAVSEVLSTAGKTVVELNHETPGFIANRLQAALVREALALVRAGVATSEMVDAVVTNSIGPRWAAAGPFQVMDLGGLDIWNALCQKLFPELSDEQSVPQELAAAVAEGRLGAKSGTGFYTHTPENVADALAGIRHSFGALGAHPITTSDKSTE